jgi:hypothetical protein
MQVLQENRLESGFSGVPPLSAVPELASALRVCWGLGDNDALELSNPLASAGAELVLQDLGGANGGPQGLLIPRSDGGFLIEVDPSPPEGWRNAPMELREEISRHRMRFTAVHELAHTLFYRRDVHPPERLVKDSEAQERFCNSLASALLVPPGAAVDLPLRPESVIRLHDTFDVSVEVAARALVNAHDKAAGWLMVLPDDQTEPWIQWGADTTRDAVRPWRVLTRLAERVKEQPAATGRLLWRTGRTTIARGLYLAERNQLVVTARAA